MTKILKTVSCILLALTAVNAKLFAQQVINEPVHVSVDLSKPIGPMKPIWAWFGYDEPNYTYMKDGRKLLSELSALSPVPVYVRTHSLLVTGDGVPSLKWGSTNVYTEDAAGKPLYNWRIVDSIFDTYIKRGMKPLAQIGFMPQALSSHPDPYKHHWKPGDNYQDIFLGWAYPPKDYSKWGELVYQWVKHCVARYGQKEVESWYWELWNEPNSGYWKGTPKEFFKLYDYSSAAVKRALPTARIGGADVTGGGMKFLNDFISHCLKDTNAVTGKIGAPLDVLLFHAKGSPTIADNVITMGISNQLLTISDMFKVISAFPGVKNLPIIIGESDPEGCAACGMATNPQNAYRNGTVYSSYTAAAFARKYELADLYQANLVGAVSWSFEFEGQPWFYGFRDLATNGVDKPVLNVFRMFGKMRGQRVAATSDHMYPLKLVLDSGIRGSSTDVGTIASKDAHSAAVMVWNYHDEDRVGVPEAIKLAVSHIPVQNVTVAEYRIDNETSNSYEVWKKMGSPQQPTTAQIAQLEKAGQLETISQPKKSIVKNGVMYMDITLPRQGVSLVTLTW